MSDQVNSKKAFRLPIILGSAAGILAVVALAGFLIFSSVCPCEQSPGGYLFGERAPQPVANWNFANNVELCQVQIWAGIRPHAINLNCMSTPEGSLYLSCSVCDTKYWAARVEANEPARLRLDGVIYPVVLNRVMDPDEMDRAWRARDSKLNTMVENPVGAPEPGAPRDPRWWTFKVDSSS